jgi:hypothetical protein
MMSYKKKLGILISLYILFGGLFIYGASMSIYQGIKQSHYALTTAEVSLVTYLDQDDDNEVKLYDEVAVSFSIEESRYEDVTYVGDPYGLEVGDEVKGYYLKSDPRAGFYTNPTSVAYDAIILVSSAFLVSSLGLTHYYFKKNGFLQKDDQLTSF